MKTALITGGTSGIGLSIAKSLLQKDYKVYLIGRNPKKGKAIESSLSAQYPGKCEFIQVDLSVVVDVKKFARKFVETHEELDLLANVAGIMEPNRIVTTEGFEKTFAVGYLSAFILSIQLVPLLEKSHHSRIVNVAGVSSFIFKAKLDFDDLTFSKNYNSFRAAITTVHAKTVLTEILSEKYAQKAIDVNSFHPGAVRSDLMKNMRWWGRAMYKFIGLFMSEDSKTGIYVCSSPEIQGTNGKYFNNKKAIDLNFGMDYKERLWKKSETLISDV